MTEKPTPRFGLMPFSSSVRRTRSAMNQTIEIVIAICKAMSMCVPRHAYRPTKTIITLPPRAMTPYYHPCPIPEQMTTLILKHANKGRLGAVDWGPNDFDVCEGDRCIGRNFCRCRHRKDARGSGQLQLANMRRRHTVAAIQRHATKRWRILRRSGPKQIRTSIASLFPPIKKRVYDHCSYPAS